MQSAGPPTNRATWVGRGSTPKIPPPRREHTPATCVTSPMKTCFVFAIYSPPGRLVRRRSSIPFRPRQINHDLLWFLFECCGALVAHLCQLLGGALLDFVVLVLEQALPYLEQIDAPVNLLD